MKIEIDRWEEMRYLYKEASNRANACVGGPGAALQNPIRSEYWYWHGFGCGMKDVIPPGTSTTWGSLPSWELSKDLYELGWKDGRGTARMLNYLDNYLDNNTVEEFKRYLNEGS